MLIKDTLKQKGLSMVELMVGIVVGMLVVGGVISFYIINVKSSAYNLRAIRLNQELRAIMDIMVSDIRRSGYWAGSMTLVGTTPTISSTPNPFTSRSGTQTDLTVNSSDSLTNNCILYSYDRDLSSDAIVTTSETYGFKLAGGNIYMLNAASAATTNDCTITGWTQITDDKTITVDTLTFSSTGSQCINSTQNLSWKLSAANSSSSACAASSANVTMNARYDGTSWTTPAYAAPATNDSMMEIRTINITLRGHHVDDSNTAITITETLQVQNDRAFLNP